MTTVKEAISRSDKFLSDTWTKAVNYAKLVTQKQSEARANRAYESGTFDSMSGNDDPQSGTIAAGGFGYRTQGQRGKRDVTKMTHAEIIDTAWYSFQLSGTAKRAQAFNMSAILGRNTAPETPDEDLQIILDQFWKRNLTDNRNLKRFMTAHYIFGELILPVFVRESDGRVLLGYIDQGDVEEVIFHPQNNLERWAVILKEQDGKKKVYRIIREDEGTVYADTVIAPKYPDKLIIWQDAAQESWESELLRSNGLSEYNGSTFYFDRNNLANQPRGYSELLQSFDWLDQNDKVLFSLAEREHLANYFSWLVTLKGADAKKIKARASELRISPPMGAGEINIHNENEEWEFVTSNLQQAGTAITAEVTKTQAIQGLNQAKHWHGEPDTTNRATAESVDSPVNRTLEHEQADMVQMLTFMCQFAADQAEIAKVYKPDEDNDITIQVPEIVKGDIVEVSDTFAKTVGSLVVAEKDLKVITRETSAAVISKIIAEYGIQYNPSDELEKVDAEIEAAKMETADGINQFLTDAIERNGT